MVDTTCPCQGSHYQADADDQELFNINKDMDEAKGEPNNGDLKMQDGDLGAAEAGTNEIASGEAGWSTTDSNAPRVNGSSSGQSLLPTGNFESDFRIHIGVGRELERIRRNKERRIARAKEQELADSAVAGVPPSQAAMNDETQIRTPAQAQAPRQRYDLYQISASYNGPLHEGIHHFQGCTSTPAVQRYLEYDKRGYVLAMDGRPRDWPADIYNLFPSEVERVGNDIQKRFAVYMDSGVVIQVELYHDEDVEELMGFLRSDAAAGRAIS